MRSMLGKNFSKQHIEIFSQETGFDISCKLSPVETICMKCQILFPGKYKKKYHPISCLLNQRVVKVKVVRNTSTGDQCLPPHTSK